LSTGATGLSAGMRAKSAGRLLLADDHGPSRPGAWNQRPATSRSYEPVASSMNSGMTGLLTYIRPVPSMGENCGGPSVTSSSAGSELAITRGTTVNGCPGSALRTTSHWSPAGSFESSSMGIVEAGVHGPFSGSGAVSHDDSSSRKYFDERPSSSTGQFVLTAKS